MKHYTSWNFNLMKNNLQCFGFGLKWKNWIDNPNPKSNFDFGLSITIRSTKLDCNPDWAIQQYPGKDQIMRWKFSKLVGPSENILTGICNGNLPCNKYLKDGCLRHIRPSPICNKNPERKSFRWPLTPRRRLRPVGNLIQ